MKHELPLDVLPTIYLVKLVALSSSLPNPTPHLDHLASFALQAVLGDAAPRSLREWMEQLKGIGGEQALDEIALEIGQQVRPTPSTSPC